VWSLQYEKPRDFESITVAHNSPIQASAALTSTPRGVIDGVSMSACLNMPIAWRCIMQDYRGTVFNQAMECLNQLASWRLFTSRINNIDELKETVSWHFFHFAFL
jgi:hypothetical protein